MQDEEQATCCCFNLLLALLFCYTIHRYIPPPGSRDMKPLTQQMKTEDLQAEQKSQKQLVAIDAVHTVSCTPTHACKESSTNYYRMSALKRKRQSSSSDTDDIIDLTQDSSQ